MSNPLADKTYLITGATRGLGRSIAIEAAQNGAHIIALGRTIGGLEELDDEIRALGRNKATLIPLDLTDCSMIDALGPNLFPKFDYIDGFIANAAYLGGLSPLTHTKTEEWAKIIAINLTANFALIRTLTPLLERAAQATALFITDNQQTNRGAAFWGPYSASKAGLESLVKSYAEETATTTIKTALIAPPPMATALRRKAFPGEDPTQLISREKIASDIIAILAERNFENGATLEVGHC